MELITAQSSRPSGPKKLQFWLASIAFVCVGVTIWFVLIFRGNLDSGKFETLRSTANSEGTIAITAKRSDHAAMRSDDYFVVLANHPYSPDELRHVYYRDNLRTVFSANRDPGTITWTGVHELLIDCSSCAIRSENINVKRTFVGEFHIRYLNFP